MMFAIEFMMRLVMAERTLSDAVVTSLWFAALLSFLTFILNRLANMGDVRDRLFVNSSKTEIEEQEKISYSMAWYWLRFTTVFYLYVFAIVLVFSLLMTLLWRGSLQHLITGSLSRTLTLTVVLFSIEFLWKDKPDATVDI